jgi:hypothetical protein
MIAKVAFGPFSGEQSGLDPRGISEIKAAKAQNVVLENGWLKPEYGYRNLDGIPANFTAAYAFTHLLGYNSSGVEKEEYVSVETRSGNTRPYSADVSTGVRTEIKNGVASVSLAASDWKGFVWDDVSYWYNPAASSIARHAIGDATSWITLSKPDAPTGGSSLVLLGSAQTAGFSGCSGSFTGAVSLATLTTAKCSLQHTASTTGAASITIDWNGSTSGIQDWTYQDAIQFAGKQPTPGFRIDPNGMTFEAINNDGSPMTLTPTMVRTDRYDPVTGDFYFSVYFDNKTRANFDNIRKIKFSYNVTNSTGTASNNLLEIYAPSYFRIDNNWGWDEIPDTREFGYTWYNSAAGIESDMKLVTCGRDYFDTWRTTPNASGVPGQAMLPYLSMGSTADGNVDKVRIYMKCSDGLWHRIGEQVDTDNTFDIQVSDAEALALPEFTPGGLKTDNLLCAARYKGWVVWGYRGRFENIRHSRIGEPELQVSDLDTGTDPNEGQNFSLRQDDPLAFHEADDALLIMGTQGIWAQVPRNAENPSPTTMTPPKLLPGSKPCAGPFASCRWKGEDGFAGAASLDLAGTLWLAQVSDQFDGQAGFRLTELSAEIRGEIDTFLRSEQSLSDYSTARLEVDEATDALFIWMGARGFELTRPSLIDGKRTWKRHKLTIPSSGTVKYLGFSPKRRMRWIRSTGQIDEFKWNSSSNAWIEGTSRHGGQAMPTDGCSYTTKMIGGGLTKVHKLSVQRDTLTDLVKVRVASTRQSQTYTCESGRLDIRCSQYQQGREHQFEIILPEGSDKVRVLEVELHGEMNYKKVDIG